MGTWQRIQIIGVVSFILALLAAELAAFALWAMPASGFLWWLNLEVFQGVNALWRHVDGTFSLDYRYTISYLLGVLALSIWAHIRRMRMAMALLSNVVFVMCGYMAFLWYRSQTMARSADLSETVFQPNESGLLVTFLIVAALFGLVASHCVYFAAAIEAWRGRRGARATAGGER